jgi:hypothetical protein
MLEVDVPLAESDVWKLHVLHWIFRSSAGLLALFCDYRFPGIGDTINCVHNNSFCSLPPGKDGVDRWDIQMILIQETHSAEVIPEKSFGFDLIGALSRPAL